MIGKDDPASRLRGHHAHAADLVRGAVLVCPIDRRKHVPQRCVQKQKPQHFQQATN